MVPYQHFMRHAVLVRREFTPTDDNDHEHCIMCGAKFAAPPEGLTIGYATPDGMYWVCDECFDEYGTEYDWKHPQ